jgi:hypothetical protein
MAQFALDRVRMETGNKNLDHVSACSEVCDFNSWRNAQAGAQKYIRERLALFEHPREFWQVSRLNAASGLTRTRAHTQQHAREETARHDAKLTAIKNAYASGKVRVRCGA